MKSNSEKVLTINKNFKVLYVILIILVVVSAMAVVFLLSTGPLGEYGQLSRTLKVGQLVDSDIIAKRSYQIIDTQATEEAKKEQENSVKPIFSFVFSTQMKNFDAIKSYSTENLSADSLNTEKADGINMILREIFNKISSTGYCSDGDIENVIKQGYSAIMLETDNQGNYYDIPVEIMTENIITESNIVDFVNNWLAPYTKLSKAEKNYILAGIISSVKPNLKYDAMSTSRMKQEVAEKLSPVIIRIEKSDIIISKDFIVTENDLRILNLLSQQNNFPTAWETIALALIILSTTIIGITEFRKIDKNDNLHTNEFVLFALVGFILTIWVSYGVGIVVSNNDGLMLEPLLPMLLIPLFMTLITGSKTKGYILSFVVSIILQAMPGATVWTFFYCLILQWTANYFVKFMNKRIDIIFQWFFTMLGSLVITLFYLMLWGMDFSKIFIAIGEMLLNVSASYLVVMVLMPVFERVFNLPTVFRLHELAYGDSPVLTRLNNVAPGTYNHSCAVADLAEAATAAIGGNALLARVGGLYHDIGKMDHPEFYTENVLNDKTSKHNKLNPGLSVSIIKNHVKTGAEKGRKAGLPEEVINIIARHHGNDVILYFYEEAKKEAAGNNEKVEMQNDFTYNSELPQTIVEGVIMLADCVEAASRNIDPSPRHFEKKINDIIMGKIERRQLQDSHLTITDLDIIQSSFVKTLISRFHTRIEYPEDED